MTDADKIEKIRKEVQDVINTTECGYCKEIFGDVKNILDTYMDIQDKAMSMYDIASKRKKYLEDVDQKAERLINTQRSYYEHAEEVPAQAPSPPSAPSRRLGGMLGFDNLSNTGTLLGGRGPFRSIINRRIQSTNEKVNKLFELRLF
jgi:hypothetical protein